jgi:hypothetical protein
LPSSPPPPFEGRFGENSRQGSPLLEKTVALGGEALLNPKKSHA